MQKGRLVAALLLLGAGFLGAQQTPPKPAPAGTAKPASTPADTTKPATQAKADTTKGAKTDTTKMDAATLRRRRLAADTVKAPLARAEMPVESNGRWHWSGEALRAAGALTLADLVARIPGVTSFRANFIPAAQFVAWNGDAGRVRVFIDGVELDAINPRNGTVLDLGTISLWQFEEVSAEPAPGELRVHLRSWRVDRVMPFTRTDIITGSENTNLYRGFFGKRLHNGGVIQVGAQQYATISPRTGGDGSALQVFGRLGWSWRKWSVDGVWHRTSMDRAATVRWPQFDEIKNANGSPAYKGSLGTAYGRLAWGDPDQAGAPWVQFIASSQMNAENSKVSESTLLSTPLETPSDTVDTASSRSQYVLAAGASKWGLRGSVTARMRASQGIKEVSPSIRLGYTRWFVSADAYAETRGADSTGRMEVSARIAPWRWLVLSGGYGSYKPKLATTGGPAFTAGRAELATSLWGYTVSGGLLTRGLTTLAPPIALDSSLVRAGTGAVKGLLITARGPILGDIGFDVSGVRWESSGAYRPQMDIHASLLLDSSFPGRFPRNNFHMLAQATYEHRTPMFFPTRTAGVGDMTGPVDALGARLEIRIQSGTVFIQSENLVGKVFDTAPGYVMPRRLQYYGLRWDFWN